ncbi:MAG: DUF1549 domain-containing protein [Verrucomicrobia bacterium]|nr:DUF1549 domain-containing protein [Verrucomicrobiota bacterium]
MIGLFPIASPAASDGADFFVRKVEPILRENCHKCHSHSAEKIKGDFLLDSREALLAGGASGLVIDLQDPGKSLLLEAIRYTNEDLQMPPKGKKLSDEQIAILTDWVKQGAPWPETPGQKMVARPKGGITAEDRRWWAFQPVAKVHLPPNDPWCANEIDRFILERQIAAGLRPAPPAAKPALVRRVYFDLIGLPPTPEQVAAFVADTSADAYATLVDRLLASPRYGERWARHWLDLVRYADSDGYRIDDFRPYAWRYRDYVIAAFNSDKPYDRFVQEQIAGDELWPDDPVARTGTGYLGNGIYEYNNRDVAGQVVTMLNDITDTTADVFMGMGLQCARCHDHKFDPILQKDYFRLQAFFAPVVPYTEVEVASPAERAAHARKLAAWEAKTADVRHQLAELDAPYRDEGAREAIEKFPPETRAMIAKPALERTPYERIVVSLAWRQVEYEWSDKRLPARVKEPNKTKRAQLLAELRKFADEKPAPLPLAYAATDIGPKAPPVTIPKKAALGDIAPGFLSVLDAAAAKIEPAPGGTTGRRTALARWLTQRENPLTSRVIVNRIWQYHFGRGLAVNASDFGKLGEKPSHPELLDWLAGWFGENGSSFKKLHRLIVTSATYTQAAGNPLETQAQLLDPENRLLWRATTRRLEAEQIRDAALAVTGELQFPPGGSPADASKPVRTIFTRVMRNTRDPVLEVFDQPEGFASTAQRNVTTTPTQSLFMINGRWMLDRARAFAGRLGREHASDPGAWITEAFRICYGRDPTGREREKIQSILLDGFSQTTVSVPAKSEIPFAFEKMKFRDGMAALLVPGSNQDRLLINPTGRFPQSDFTVEAFINLKSVHATGTVSPIVSQWDGRKGEPGWSLGVTGRASRNMPQTLVLQLSGDPPWKPGDPVEPVFSGLHIDLGKPYFVAVAVRLGETAAGGVTFYCKDLSNDDEPMQVAQVAHAVTSGIRSPAPVVIGGTAKGARNLFDGVVDDVRLSDRPLRAEQLLFNSAAVDEHTVGYWKFETANPYADSSGRGSEIAAQPSAVPPDEPRTAALVNLCHVLLNSNEFLYVD